MTATAPTPPDDQVDPRLRARAELLWYLRHEDALRRWPVLGEPWARAIEEKRLGETARRSSGTDGGSAQ